MPFPFTDLSAFKVRPAVVLTPEVSGADLVVAYISSVLPDGALPEACLLIAPEHAEFGGTGLRQASIVRLDSSGLTSPMRIAYLTRPATSWMSPVRAEPFDAFELDLGALWGERPPASP